METTRKQGPSTECYLTTLYSYFKAEKIRSPLRKRLVIWLNECGEKAETRMLKYHYSISTDKYNQNCFHEYGLSNWSEKFSQNSLITICNFELQLDLMLGLNIFIRFGLFLIQCRSFTHIWVNDHCWCKIQYVFSSTEHPFSRQINTAELTPNSTILLEASKT